MADQVINAKQRIKLKKGSLISPISSRGNIMMKIKQNMNYQNVQKCLIKYHIIVKVQTSSTCENHHRSVAEWPMLEKT